MLQLFKEFHRNIDLLLTCDFWSPPPPPPPPKKKKQKNKQKTHRQTHTHKKKKKKQKYIWGEDLELGWGEEEPISKVRGINVLVFNSDEGVSKITES